MKTIINRFVFLCVSVMAFASCSDILGSKTYMAISYIGGIDFVVTNVTTGEEVDGSAGIIIGGEPDKLVVHSGDQLRLTFTPPEKYAEYSWRVYYTVFDETFTRYAPYVMDYTVGTVAPGEYKIGFSGEIDDKNVVWSEESSFSTSVDIIVEE